MLACGRAEPCWASVHVGCSSLILKSCQQQQYFPAVQGTKSSLIHSANLFLGVASSCLPSVSQTPSLNPGLRSPRGGCYFPGFLTPPVPSHPLPRSNQKDPRKINIPTEPLCLGQPRALPAQPSPPAAFPGSQRAWPLQFSLVSTLTL